MRKTLTRLIAVMVSIVFLCSCSQVSGGDSDAVSQNNTSNPNSISPDTTPPFDGGAQMVSSVYMIDLYTTSNNGFYESLSIKENGQNIVYTDYATKTRVYLCNRADCTHDNESCTSWFDGYIDLSLVMNLQKTKLFVFKSGSVEEGTFPQIYVMDPNGANRKMLVQFKANERFIDGCAADSENLYFAVDVVDHSGATSKELRQVNMETGDVKTLLTYGASDWLMGAFEDQLIIVSLNPASVEYTYTAYSLTTTEQREFYRYTVADTSGSGWGNITRVYNDKLYIVEPTNNEKASIHVMDIKTGEQKTLTTELPYYTLDGTFVHDFVDNHMIIAVSDNRGGFENYKGYMFALDLATNELIELTLQQPPVEDIVITTFVMPVGVSDTQYLVQSATEYKMITLIGNEGIPYQTEAQVLTYSMISKENYWNSIPEYIAIEDTVMS